MWSNACTLTCGTVCVRVWDQMNKFLGARLRSGQRTYEIRKTEVLNGMKWFDDRQTKQIAYYNISIFDSIVCMAVRKSIELRTWMARHNWIGAKELVIFHSFQNDWIRSVSTEQWLNSIFCSELHYRRTAKMKTHRYWIPEWVWTAFLVNLFSRIVISTLKICISIHVYDSKFMVWNAHCYYMRDAQMLIRFIVVLLISKEKSIASAAKQ